MKQKYAIIRDDDQNTLIIREYAELDKEMMSLLCEETYLQKDIQSAIKKGHSDVVDMIRTNNMYPPTVFADPIAKAIESIFAKGGNPSAELFFDDKELFIKAEIPEDTPAEDEDKDVAVDDLLEDETDSGTDEKSAKDPKSKASVKQEEGDTVKDA